MVCEVLVVPALWLSVGNRGRTSALVARGDGESQCLGLLVFGLHDCDDHCDPDLAFGSPAHCDVQHVPSDFASRPSSQSRYVDLRLH